MPTKKQQLNITLSESLSVRLREYAAQTGLSLNRAAEAILIERLDAKPAPPHGGKRKKQTHTE